MDELANSIEAACSRLQVSLEHTANHLGRSPFAAFASGLHVGGVSCDGITCPSHTKALLVVAAMARDLAQQFVHDNAPEANREAARQVHAALQVRLKTTNALGLLRSIGKGIGAEFAEANKAGVADLELLRLILRSTYGNVEILLTSLSGASKP